MIPGRGQHLVVGKLARWERTCWLLQSGATQAEIASTLQITPQRVCTWLGQEAFKTYRARFIVRQLAVALRLLEGGNGHRDAAKGRATTAITLARAAANPYLRRLPPEEQELELAGALLADTRRLLDHPDALRPVLEALNEDAFEEHEGGLDGDEVDLPLANLAWERQLQRQVANRHE